jgi:DNA primase
MIDKKELKQRLPLEVALAFYGHPVNSRDGFIPCPFHTEETPSFHYDLGRESFYCHGQGCDASGDIYNFIQRKEGCDFLEALHIANGILRKHKNSGGNMKGKSFQKPKYIGKHRIIEEKKTKGEETQKRFCEVMRGILNAFPLPKEICKKYLCSSTPFTITGNVFQKEEGYMTSCQESYTPPGFSCGSVKALRIGYCGTRYKRIIEQLKQKGFTEGELIESGFFRTDRNGHLYLAKHMRGRILYPFLRNGQVVQIVGRKIDGFCTPNKYTKSKHCPLMGQIFNHDILEHSPSVLITEGVTDCIKANEAGIPSISPVAKDITNITVIELAKKLKEKHVAICFDNDRNGSGQKGARLTQRKLEKHGIECTVITLPRRPKMKKIDVCEFINTNGDFAFRNIVRKQGFDVFGDQ